MENLDIPTAYSEIRNAINIDDHEKIVHLSDKIIKKNGEKNEKEAFNCKIVALINLGRYDEVISLLEKSSFLRDYSLEYSYALHEKGQYKESINFLKQNSKTSESTSELIAQNYYKMGSYLDSFNIYNQLVMSKLQSSDGLSEDLITNCLASYAFSGSDADITYLLKFLNTWEAFYNYCVISLRQKKFNECLESLVQMQSIGRAEEDELSDHKFNYLIYSIIQYGLEGFDLTKHTNLYDMYQGFVSSGSSCTELLPFYYCGLLSVKKDGEQLGESLRKFDAFLKTEKKLTDRDRETIILNKVIMLLRANKINDGKEVFKALQYNPNDVRHFLIQAYIAYKSESLENFLVGADTRQPEAGLIQLQVELHNLNPKDLSRFHKKLISFTKENYNYCTNVNFLKFFVHFYQIRQIKDLLAEFLEIFIDRKNINDKNALNVLSDGFYYCGLHQHSATMLEYILSSIDPKCMITTKKLIKSLSLIDVEKSNFLRSKVDTTHVDMSVENISSLLTEVVLKFKRNVIKSEKKKKKKKVRWPKNFNHAKPGMMPDPERWVPRIQRKKYKSSAKNKRAYQGGTDSQPVTKTTTGAVFTK